ncbi:adenine phosphoribosyltransferase [Thraustotheca clavata]|uniref:adenine phosphoribosyltransferase n=1 Tax=Thraustotheca clavata TaxID=74557 RepID=A0A1V9YYB7_9STRA|nr:adenine phosphoribosyltransferase [Thraustotheca clavata]
MDQKKQVAACIPIVPFKGVAFYDIGGLLANPTEFALCMDLLVELLTPLCDKFSAIGCFDARGFLFGPLLGYRLNKKVFMLRKEGKMPRVIDTVTYGKEYTGDNKHGLDSLSIQEGSVNAGDSVILIDDLMATGGTMNAGVELIKRAGGSVLMCVCLIELGALNGRQAITMNHPDTPFFTLLSEDLWTK